MFAQLPSLNNLKAFAAAAHFRSFKQAAAALHVTPTAISHQIKQLEQFLNVQLFERQVRQVVLTAQGQKLAATTERIFSDLSSTLTELSKPATQVTLSCCTSFATLWLAPRLADFQQRHPDIDVQILASDSLLDFRDVAQLDLALRYGSAKRTVATSATQKQSRAQPVVKIQSMSDRASTDASTDTSTEASTEASIEASTQLGTNKPEQPDQQEILLTHETINCYRATNRSAQACHQQLFVTQWRDSSALANLPWQQHIDGLGFTVRSFEQEQYTLQAALAGQGVALLSNVLAEAVVQQGWLNKVDALPAFTGYGYWLRVNPQSAHRYRVQALAHWLTAEFAALSA